MLFLHCLSTLEVSNMLKMFILYDKPVEDKSIYDNKVLHNLLSLSSFREGCHRFIQPFAEIADEAKICNVFNGIYICET